MGRRTYDKSEKEAKLEQTDTSHSVTGDVMLRSLSIALKWTLTDHEWW